MKEIVVKLLARERIFELVFLFVILELVNIVLLDSYANLLLTIPQFLIVVYYIIKRDIRVAFLLHVVFTLTAFDSTSASFEGDMYSYSEFKLIGPLTLSYINTGMIWVQSKRYFNSGVKSSLIIKFRNIVSILFLISTIIGIIGLCLFGYRIGDFVTPFIYLLVGLINLDIFVDLYNRKYLKHCYICALSLLIAAPFATFVSFFILNIKSSYGIFDALIFNEEFMMAPSMLILLFKGEHKIYLLLSLLCYFACVASASRGGFFYIIAASLVCCIFLLYRTNTKKKIVTIVKMLVPVLIVTVFPLLNYFQEMESLAGVKFNDFLSLLSALFSFDQSLISSDNIQASPYTRIAEIVNVVECGIDEPLALFFGRGYGGQYYDVSHMFENIDLTDGGGAFSIEAVKSGKFGYAHSFLPMILLWNGVLGLFLLVRMGIQYLKKVKISPMFFAAFILFFYSFYFNPSIFIAVSFCLFGAEYKLVKEE